MAMKGLRPSLRKGGFLSDPAVPPRNRIASGYATEISHMDPLMLAADNTGNYVRSDGTKVDAVFRGMLAARGNGETYQEKFWPAGTTYIGDCLLQISDLQTDGPDCEIVADGAVGANAIGKLADMNMPGPDAVFHESLVTLKTSTIGTGTALRIIGVSSETGNGWGSPNTVLRVRRAS